nr:MAG TPA: restriction alleviation protein [Caudoviricetes sp.]
MGRLIDELECCENRTEIKLDKKDSINAWNRRVNDGEID